MMSMPVSRLEHPHTLSAQSAIDLLDVPSGGLTVEEAEARLDQVGPNILPRAKPPVEDARNSTLLLLVLFENVQVFNSRSETLSAFRHNPLRNRLLLFGTAGAQLIHIAALYTPGLNSLLQAHPVSFSQWITLLMIASVVLFVMEGHKWTVGRRAM